MSSRLSDLLERIRPAGAPGAATEATTQRAREAAEEIAPVAAVLATFDHEAQAVVAAAGAQAAEIRGEAERRARRITADLPDRVAQASGRAAAPRTDGVDVEQARLAAEAKRRIDRLQGTAQARIEPVVQEALGAIWAMVTPPRAGP